MRASGHGPATQSRASVGKALVGAAPAREVPRQEEAALAWLTAWTPGARKATASDLPSLEAVLGDPGSETLETLRKKAATTLAEHRGTTVYYRGLLELSNQCDRDCLYCGIRASNTGVRRYRMDRASLVETALWCADQGYGSLTLQSGEVLDPAILGDLVDTVAEIRQGSRRPELPEGLGLTLSLGELPDPWLKAFRDAGAHRYLLRIETSNPRLYAHLHPDQPDWTQRRDRIRHLRDTGWQTGTGVMIGLPGQTIGDLARDLLFFVEEGIHMVGMGPYQPHAATPLTREVAEASRPSPGDRATPEGQAGPDTGAQALPPWAWWDQGIAPAMRRFELSLRMIGLARLLLPTANIAAATALQALHPFGRERGLDFGANILMPLVTPGKHRADYQLYDQKPCADEETDQCRSCLEGRVAHTRREVGYHRWGDSLAFHGLPLKV